MEIRSITLDEHDSDFETQRVIHVHHDKGLSDCELENALQVAPGMVVCVWECVCVLGELGKDVRSEEQSLGWFSSPLARETSISSDNQ